MILTDGAKSPKIHPSARIAPNAVISGDVEVGPNCSIGYGAVLTAESGPIRLQGDTVVMEGAVLRGIRDNPLEIGQHVMIGPQAVLNGCRVESECFVATRAVVFNGARIGRRTELRIGALVHLRSHLPEDSMVPIGWIAVGAPAEILPPDRHDDIWAIQKELGFPKYVFGADRPPPGQTIMPDAIPRYVTYLKARHQAEPAPQSDPQSAPLPAR